MSAYSKTTSCGPSGEVVLKSAISAKDADVLIRKTLENNGMNASGGMLNGEGNVNYQYESTNEVKCKCWLRCQ